jgi:hypothetical protein
MTQALYAHMNNKRKKNLQCQLPKQVSEPSLKLRATFEFLWGDKVMC